MTTFYDILGVAPTAEADEIKAAFRHLAMQFHPDKTPGANKSVQRLIEDKFREVKEAYDTLRDGTMRAEYDNKLSVLRSPKVYQTLAPPPPQPSQTGPLCRVCHRPVPTWITSTEKFCTYCGSSFL